MRVVWHPLQTSEGPFWWSNGRCEFWTQEAEVGGLLGNQYLFSLKKSFLTDVMP